ncbi:MAG: 2-amino-4-hydroxy-6-hydroxymethyldihydropteridine diphosphokinase [Planctomycetota bacterium]|jgi:2-amino-4-hydroxy-6-hydroxymethyldihydropteridine diphosphokinase
MSRDVQPKGERFPKGRDERPGARLVVLGLGSNVDGKGQIARAIDRLVYSFDLLVKSTRYVGPAEGGPNDTGEPMTIPPEEEASGENLRLYSNAAVLIRTADTFQEIRKELRRIEKTLGRTREDPRRVEIDIDILLIQGEVVRNKHDEIVVPHPDLDKKRHAALPSAEVAPSLRHPKTKERLAEIAARLA